MQCINCNKTFEGRKDARCCSARCRKQLQRKRDKPVTDKPISVTQEKAVTDKDQPETQSHSPLMVGYVPPEQKNGC